MALSNQPIFPTVPVVGNFGKLLTTAMTAAKAYDGTEAVGTSMVLLGTVGNQGNRMDTVRANLTSTAGAVPSGTTTATLLRIWATASGQLNTNAANNMLLHPGFPIPAVNMTLVLSNGLIVPELVIPIFDALPASTQIYAGLVTAIGGTNCALAVRLSGGDF